MAKTKQIELFYTHVKQEGEAGATRGKVPVALCAAIGAGDGDMIEWEVQGGVVIGGHTMTKAEKRDWERENKRAAPAPKKTAPKKAAKPVVKSKKSKSDWDDDDDVPVKKGKKTAKANKRKTRVEYDEPEVRKPKGIKKPAVKLKVKKKGR